MSQAYLMGIDAGSSGGRCLLVEIDTGIVHHTFRPWEYRTVPGMGGWGFDMDTNMIWSALGDASRDVLQLAGASPGQILGIAATSMRDATVVIDQRGLPLLATPNRDARASTEALLLGEERGEEFYRRTGRWPSPIFAASRLLWMANETPETLSEAHAVLSLSDWLVFRLSGVVASDFSQAGESLLFDLETQDWAFDLIDSLNLPQAIFPPLHEAGISIGELTQDAAQHFGLSSGTPVALGGGDTQAGLLGTGALQAGDMAAITGTTAPIQLVTKEPILDPQARLWTGSHLMRGSWVLESNAGGTGEMLEWLAEVLYAQVKQPVAMLIADAQESPPGAAGILSTVGAQLFNSKEMSLPVGHLTLSHLIVGEASDRRRHFARASLEGMAYGLLENTHQILEVGGIQMPSLRLAGGMSRSMLWTKILSNVFNSPVEVGIPEASALGAAICAGVGAGIFNDLSESAQSLVKIIHEHEPITEIVELYQDFYADWKRLRDARLEADKIAADLSLQAIMRTTSHLEHSEIIPGFQPRILVTAEMDPSSLETLNLLGDVEHRSYRDEMTMLTGEDMVEALIGYHVFITEIDILDAEVLQQLPDLRVVFSCRGNPVNIDVNACTALGIPVLNTPGRNADAVADLAVAFILMLARKIPQASGFLRQPDGEEGDMGRMGQAHFELQGLELWRKTVGLIGFGAVGRKVAHRLGPFGVHLLVYDPFAAPIEILQAGAELVPFEEILRKSDFISLHAAVTDETRGLLGADQLAQMKSGAYLINTARAALVDEDALIDALASGHLRGAALDVFAIEPPGSDHPLLQLPNVIATPHVGGNTLEVSTHQGNMVVEDLKRILQGSHPEHVLNPETLEHFNWTGPRLALARDVLSELEMSSGPAVSDLQIEHQSRRKEQPDVPRREASGILRGIKSKLRKPDLEKGEIQADMGNLDDVKEHMTAILKRFLQKLCEDDGLQSFAQGKQVIMHYILTDLDLDFFTAFESGEVHANLGEPPSKTDVTLKMKADLLDGMFTGRTNAMRAAMTGKLAFSGDTMKGMTLQRIQKDLMRLYSEARAEVGDPGDLTQITETPSSVPVKSPTSPSISPPSLPHRTQKVGDERDELLAILNELYTKGLITATGGNLSVRVADRENQLWITPSQIFKGNLRPEMMVRIDLDGNPLDPDALTASSERFVHCAVFRHRSDIGAVIHTHAPKAMTLALAELPFLPISTQAAFIGEIPRVPFIMPGTKDLGDQVASALGQGVAVLMQNHGLVVAGSTLRRAADLTEVIEQTADAIVTCYTLGKEPPVLPEDVLKELREIGKMMA